MTTTRGRRPGSPDTREEILSSARELFAEGGFAGTSVRAVAGRAGVDPALVHHYFGTKDDLFMAALQLSVDPRQLLAPILAGGADGAAERLLGVFLTVWDDPRHQPSLVGLFRSVTGDNGAHMLRDGFLPVVLRPALQALAVDRVDLRLSLLASQMLGLILCRYVLGVEPLASLPAETVVAAYAPTLQRYLTGELPEVTSGP
jgi:AcrR family transcriptional regulator